MPAWLLLVVLHNLARSSLAAPHFLTLSDMAAVTLRSSIHW
jgi:hypothetical protein